MSLTKKRKIFVEHYLSCWNASEAARKAGYSERSAGAIGHELLKNPEVNDEIARRIEETTLGANEVLARLGKMARGVDLTQYAETVETYAVNKDKEEYLSGIALKLDLEQLRKDGYGELVKSLRSTSAGVVIELHDQKDALIQLGKHLNIFTDRLDVTSKGEAITKDVGDLNRSISALADAIGETVSREGAEPDGEVVSAE